MTPTPSQPSPPFQLSVPPSELIDVAAKVEARLSSLFEAESLRWEAIDPRLAEAIGELGLVLTTGGKRLRAGFCYWAWWGLRGRASCDESLVIDVCTAFELLQSFALIHDDIMDDSAMRRGRPTVHVAQAERLGAAGWQGEARRFGEGVAILLGDLSHVYADRLAGQASPAARLIWDELRIELNLGQYLDLRSAAAGDLDTETAHQVSTFKSALYTIVRPLQLGASIDGPADGDLLAMLDRYGRPLGRAFQLKDDLLGVLGDERAIGKPVGDDLREGKPTELAALALERADQAQRSTLGRIGRRDLDDDDVAAIVEVLVATEAVDDIGGRIDDLVAEASAVVPALPFDDAARTALHSLANYVATRTS